MKRFLLPGLLAVPLLAQADPLNNGALAIVAYVSLALVALLALLVVGLVLAFLRPRSQALQLAQGGGLLLFAGVYYLGDRHLLDLLGSGMHLVLSAVFPLGLLLNGLTQARRQERPLAGRLWAGVAVTGSLGLVWVLAWQLLFGWLWQPDFVRSAWRTLWYLLLALPIEAAGWLLVLGLLRRAALPAASLWQPWWATPASAAGLVLGYQVVTTWATYFNRPNMLPNWGALVGSDLLAAAVCWLSGVAMLRLVRPLAATGVVSPPG